MERVIGDKYSYWPVDSKKKKTSIFAAAWLQSWSNGSSINARTKTVEEINGATVVAHLDHLVWNLERSRRSPNADFT